MSERTGHTTNPNLATEPAKKNQRNGFFSNGSGSSFFNTPVQAKLNVNEPGDKFEKEADSMADKVVNRSANPNSAPPSGSSSKNEKDDVQRKEGEQEEQKEPDIQRQPVFESAGQPRDESMVQRMQREDDLGNWIHRASDGASVEGMSKRDAIVAIARSKLGTIKAKQAEPDGKRVGSIHLLEIFNLAAPGVWPEDSIVNLKDGFPSWCGIFTVYCIKKAGIDVGNWQQGKGVSAFGTLAKTNNPQAGDIGYMEQNQHHALIVKVDGDKVHSIDGNSGMFSEVIENTRPLKAYLGFFTPFTGGVMDVQKKENGNTAGEASHAVESGINSSKGGGSTLDSGVRSEMESGLGKDFSGVHVHNDSASHQMNRNLNAQAFTHGNDIYFNEGKYNPQSSSGKHLLAHELTHTVQQTGGAARQSIQRQNGASTAGSSNIDFTNSTISIPKINMPQGKKRQDNSMLAPPLIYPKGYKRKDSYKDVADESSSAGQRDVWKKAVEADVAKSVTALTQKAKSANAFDAPSEAYYLKHKTKGEKLKLVGKETTIIEAAIIPTWTKAGLANAFDVDHVKELQLGGANFHDNMELLNFSINRGAGNAVKNEIDQKITKFIGDEEKKNSDAFKDSKFPENSDKAREKYSIRFEAVDFNNEPKANGIDHYWTLAELQAGKQLENFMPMKAGDIKKIKGEKDKELIYTSPAGGSALTRGDLKGFNKGKNIKFTDPVFEDQTGKTAGTKVGSFDVEFALYGSAEEKKKFTIPILQMDGVLFGGSIPRRGQSGGGGLEQLIVGLQLPGMSPITVEQADLVPGKGLMVSGKIHPTLEVIKGVDIDFFIEGDNIGISKTLSAEDIKVPPPFKINDASVTVFAGTAGFGVRGEVNFEITGLGKGKVSGKGATDGKFGIKGEFEFDKKLFSGGAKIEVEYDNVELWKVKGEIGIKKDTVKGIKSGTITVAYANNVLEAQGTAETTIPGVKEVTLRVKFGEDVSEIEGRIKVEKLPGIKEGSGNLKIAKNGNEYDFSGSGKITPDIPGLDTQIDFTFHNDIFKVDASVEYKRDRLEGKLHVGITNEVLAEGVPTGKKSEEYMVWGGGQLSLKITDDLKVTAGVKLLPNGEVEVTGRIDLPKKFNLFPAPMPRKFKRKEVGVSFPTPIPIISVYVMGYFETEAEIGGGYLDDVFAEVTYNPSRPEEMKITGGMSFNMPAYAQIKAGVEFGVKASLLIASIRGGIDLSAALRLEVPQPILKGTLAWSPANGFEVDGLAKIGIMPSLTLEGAFKITGEIDLWLTTLSKSWSWPFASMTIAPDAPFGMEFPFKYNKNTPFSLSFDDVKFNYPSAGAMADAVGDAVIKEIDSYLG